MNNILCPIDFSEASNNALEYSVKIAEKHHSSLRLVHVVTPEEYTDQLSNDPEHGVVDYEKQPEARLKKLLDKIDTEASLDLSSMKVTEGELIDKLKEIIESESISLVVMGTEGVSNVSEAQMGSNTVKLIEETDVPILCIPTNTRYTPITNIVYGSEFSMDDKDYLQQIINFAYAFDARITVSHITKSSDAADSDYDKYVKEIMSYFVYGKLTFEQFVTDTETHIAMEHILNKNKADLLILVHKQRNFLTSLFHRSLTKKMSYMTNFPLLVFRN